MLIIDLAREFWIDVLKDTLEVTQHRLDERLDWLSGTSFNEYTQGWLDYLAREIEALQAKESRLVRRLSKMGVSV